MMEDAVWQAIHDAHRHDTALPLSVVWRDNGEVEMSGTFRVPEYERAIERYGYRERATLVSETGDQTWTMERRDTSPPWAR